MVWVLLMYRFFFSLVALYLYSLFFFFLKMGGHVCYLFFGLVFSLTVSPGQKLARYGFEIFVRENFKWGECENLLSIRPQARSSPIARADHERGRRRRQRGGRRREAHFRSGWRRGTCAKTTTTTKILAAGELILTSIYQTKA